MDFSITNDLDIDLPGLLCAYASFSLRNTTIQNETSVDWLFCFYFKEARLSFYSKCLWHYVLQTQIKLYKLNISFL